MKQDYIIVPQNYKKSLIKKALIIAQLNLYLIMMKKQFIIL